mmetsp:Transcript_20849/g.45264  ORF Transcript_20849/g.45264 Transcript_20849/m.45264 type:complete len:202 (-) Transcript_20849:313-918(-)
MSFRRSATVMPRRTSSMVSVSSLREDAVLPFSRMRCTWGTVVPSRSSLSSPPSESCIVASFVASSSPSSSSSSNPFVIALSIVPLESMRSRSFRRLRFNMEDALLLVDRRNSAFATRLFLVLASFSIVSSQSSKLLNCTAFFRLGDLPFLPEDALATPSPSDPSLAASTPTTSVGSPSSPSLTSPPSLVFPSSLVSHNPAT